TIPGRGDNSKYDFIDMFYEKQAYYRLKMIDLDGQFSFSNIIVVKKSNRSLISAGPNPVSTEYNIRFNSIEDHGWIRVLSS
ncbi:hypothetical protein, partial [Klebsiella pneumoniae]|uniref:hypothetical protein n=1 Tax=Klebsiella pneumoniae TaxID=573 RepID=UPI001D0F2FB7